jgi:hypothetical protein
MSDLRTWWERGQRGWPPNAPVAQFPNAPLLLALAGWLLDLLAGGTAGDVGRAVFYTGLAAWAWLELSDGANALRRVLGAGGLVFVVVRIADALGA